MVGIIVGATGGIGSACAELLAPCVDRLLLVARSAQARDGKSLAVPADIATTSGRDEVVKAVGSDTIRWLVVASGVPLRGRLAELNPATIEQAVAINLLGPVLLIQRLLACNWAKGSSIAVIGSISATRALPNRAVYGGTKAGLEHFATALAAELSPRGIRINVVAPGVIDTPFLGDNRKILSQWVEEHVPARRIGTADEVARVVKYVLLDAPDYVTGTRIAVDGGAEVVG